MDKTRDLLKVFIMGCILMIVILTFQLISNDRSVSEIETKKITYADKAERDEIIKSVIVWETDYSKELEDEILYQFNQIPDVVIDSWLSEDCKLVICPNDDEYLKADTDSYNKIINANCYFSGYYAAYNAMAGNDNGVICSDIHVLGAPIYINSLPHEIGHYVYYEYFGINTDYSLPNYETDSIKYVENIKNGNTYYLDHGEYFAEMFEYTLINGVTEEYADTYVIQKIIENF